MTATMIKGKSCKHNPFDYIVLGFIMKLLGNVASFFMSYHIADAVFGLISWYFIIKGLSRIPSNLKFPFTGGYQFLLSFFILQCIVMIIRGYLIDYNYIWFTTIGFINFHLFQPTYILCYLMPFVTLIPIRYFNFRLMLNYSILFFLITFILSIVYSNKIMLSSLQIAMGMGKEESMILASDVSFYGSFAFLTLFYYYLPRNKWRINLVGLFLLLLLVVIGARRGGILLTSIILLGAIYFRAKAKSKSKRIFVYIFSLSVLAILAYFVLTSQMSSYLLERGFEDSRSSVEQAMFSQMSTTDWIFGKGLNGRYYCPIQEDDYLNGWRYGVETGFYNLVLKGGLLLAISYILLLAIPAYKGLFKSKNLFCKAGGFYIVHSLISLWPFGILAFDLNFFVIWMMVVCCMNKSVRKMTDN